jgi:hypothetical protein
MPSQSNPESDVPLSNAPTTKTAGSGWEELAQSLRHKDAEPVTEPSNTGSGKPRFRRTSPAKSANDYSELRLNPSYVFELPQDKMLLVLKALGGRLRDHEIRDARILGDELTEQRASELERVANQLRNAIR